MSATGRIALLRGYDTMFLLLEDFWNRDGKQSNDLATLLGSMTRTASGPPLDAAMWTDWLDAVLSVRPDLKLVESARAKIYDDHRAFLKVLEIEDVKTQRSELDLLRDEQGKRSWHIVGEEKIDLLAAYAAVALFLRAYWSKSDEILRVLRQFESGQSVLWERWINAAAQQN